MRGYKRNKKDHDMPSLLVVHLAVYASLNNAKVTDINNECSL